MARVFTTEFELDHQQCKALVIIQESLVQPIVHIKFFDNIIIETLGNDSIKFVGLSGYKSLNHFKSTAAKKILETVCLTILDHLSK